MIKTLRRKFVFASVSTITFVVILVFFTVNYLSYKNITDRNTDIMERIRNDQNILNQIITTRLENGNRGVLSADKYFYNEFIAVQVKDDETISTIYNSNIRMDEEIARELVEKAISKKDDEGYVDYHKFGYIEREDYKYLILIDCKKELSIFYENIRNSIIVGTLIILGASCILMIVSKRVVAPMEVNYKKQKQFITDASHELKTPLTIISSNADVLEMEIGESKWLANIHNQIDRLTQLINSLVAFSRAEETEKIERIKFSMTDLVKSRVEDFEELANFKGRKLDYNIQDEVYYNGDQQTIMQVIDILLDNAIKYADENSKIDIELTGNKNEAYFVVKNNADGIEKGNLNKVFDRFYRLDESRNSKIKGYGIGLSLAKLIVERHKSQIKAYAPEDNKFVIEIKFNGK